MVLMVEKPTDGAGLILEAWAQGFMVGALVIMACITVANMRKKVLLHKLILVEIILGIFHGTFIFTWKPVYNWYLSTTAILLNTSWVLHNVIAWMKNKPFLGRKASAFYIITVLMTIPYWILEIVANFLYFDNISALFTSTRPWEALCRDPWWIFTVCNLLWNIKTRYEFGLVELIRVSPRFGVLLTAIVLSIIFILLDILAVTGVIAGPGLPDGINPFWKLGFVFKVLTDTIILDDFKTALDRLKQYKLERMGSVLSDGVRGNFVDVEQARQKKDSAVRGLHDPLALDWSKVGKCEHIDLEAALQSAGPTMPGEPSAPKESRASKESLESGHG